MKNNEVVNKEDDPVIKVQKCFYSKRLVDGYRKRTNILMMKKSDVLKVNRLMEQMFKKSQPIKMKYDNLRDREVNKIEKPFRKDVKKILGVDF